MPYITREDGEHFVVPSYRDVLTGRNKNQLKKDILLLTQSYGEYITLQRKSTLQFEIAFSPEPGYLLGESVWHYFKQPTDMIYCEAIPNTTEAILVIVKADSVYLDGSFPIESISEELIIFLTQQNNFEVYIYGDVPISQTPAQGKFSFDPNSVRSFIQLDKPIFQSLPLLKIYQLQLVATALKNYGIGVFPTGQVIGIVIALGVLFVIYSFISQKPPVQQTTTLTVNPYIDFNKTLESPDPGQLMQIIISKISLLYAMPGWKVDKISYDNKLLTAEVQSDGSKIEDLSNWAQTNNLKVDFVSKGITLSIPINIPNRPPPAKIYPLKQVIVSFVDALGSVYPGNHMSVGDMVNKGSFMDMTFTLSVDNTTPVVLSLIGEKFKNLPFVLQKMNLSVENGSLSGSITIEALGS